jgi:acyl carrier protein
MGRYSHSNITGGFMEKVEFIKQLKAIMEIEEKNITEETNLRDLGEYNSLAVMSIVALVDDKFGKRISGKDFAGITTVKSLMQLIGMENFK